MANEQNKTPIAGKVVKVMDSYTLVINIGHEHGIEKGDQFLVYRPEDEELIDPDSGESLGKLEIVRGTGAAIHVQDKITTIKSNRTTSKGKVVRRVTNPRINSLTLLGLGESHQEIIEEPEKEAITFSEPEVGDFVKKI